MPNPAYADGARVRLVARPGHIGTIQRHRLGPNDSVEYRVSFGQDEEPWVGEHSLTAVEEMPLRQVGRRELMRNLALVKMRGRFNDIFYSYLASRTQVEPYQFRPAAKFIESASHRLFIADEVGLGKTIEAGIIFLEMKARNQMKRVLVICPSRLREKWRSEFRSRFNESLTDLNRGQFAEFLDQYERFQDASTIFGVVAMETIRDRSIRERMEEVGAHFDLIIIDEAHHLRNQSSQIHRTGLVLSGNTDAMLMLSATPINIHQEDLYNLLHILDGGEFLDMQTMSELFAPVSVLNRAMNLLGREPDQQRDSLQELQTLPSSSIGQQIAEYPEYEDIVRRLESGVPLDRAEFVGMKRRLSSLSPLSNHINRTRKREVQPGVTREPHVIGVEMTSDEVDLYNGLLRYVKMRYFSTNQTTPPGFVLVTRERQITSCLLAAAEVLLKDTSNHNTGEDIGYEGNDIELEDVPYTIQSLMLQGNMSQLRQHLLDLAEGLGSVDSKISNFLEGLREVHRDNPTAKVLVFSSFKATLRYLNRQLSRESSWIEGGVHHLDGDVAVGERPRIIDRFKEVEGFSVLLMSEVGSEGLDFQFTDVMFNYDLPWNPMRVEQRIGRIDRYGQQSAKVRVYSFILSDTVEERILGRLYDRIGVFRESIGELEPILGGIIERLTHDIFTGALSPEQEENMAEQTLIALEAQKVYQEELEQIEDELMGQDILLGQEHDSRIETGRYLGEEELRAVLESGLTQYNCHLNDKSGGYFYLRSTPMLRNDLSIFCEQQRVPHEIRQELLAGLDEGGIPITFKGELAHQRELSHLINFDHPLIRFAASRVPEEETSVRNLPLVRLTSSDWPLGYYSFFIYQLNIISAEPRSELFAVVLDQHNGESVEALAKQLLVDLWQTTEWSGRQPNAMLSAWEIYESYANDAFMPERDAVEQSVKERNDRLVNIRQAALRRTHDVKRRRLEQWHSEASDDRIKRMRETQINNATAELAGKLAEQEQLRAVVVSSDLLLQGIIQVVVQDEESDDEVPGNGDIADV